MYKENYYKLLDVAPAGEPSTDQVKVLNLDDFSSRVIEVNVDAVEYPSEQYCENGFYYAVEKKDKISICTKGQWDIYCRRVIRAYKQGKNQPVFTKANLITIAVFIILSIILAFAVIKYNDDNSGSAASNNGSTSNYTQSDFNNKEM